MRSFQNDREGNDETPACHFAARHLSATGGARGVGGTLIAIIQKNDDAVVKAFNAGGGTAVSNLYTADATILPPAAEMHHGGPAIATFWQGAIQSGLKNASLTAMFVEAYGPVAREIGDFSFDAPGAGW